MPGRAKNELEIPTEVVMKGAEEAAKAAIGTYVFGWSSCGRHPQHC